MSTYHSHHLPHHSLNHTRSIDETKDIFLTSPIQTPTNTHTTHETQGAGNPWKQDLEIRQILGAPLPDHYWKVPKKESDAWKENEITFESLMKRLRDSDKELLITMRRSRRPMLFSILKDEDSSSDITGDHKILIVNAGTKSVTEATGIEAASSMG